MIYEALPGIGRGFMVEFMEVNVFLREINLTLSIINLGFALIRKDVCQE